MVSKEEARAVWLDLEGQAKDFFHKMLLCGSIRREREEVHDIDFVGIPVVQSEQDLLGRLSPIVPFFSWVMENADREPPSPVKDTFKFAPRQPVSIHDFTRKYVRFFFKGIHVDAYLARPDTFWPLVVIRTGPPEQNIALAARAKRMGLALRHQGIIKDGVFVGTESEEAFFGALNLPYCPPGKRDDSRWIRLIRSSGRYEGEVWSCEL